MVDKKVNLKESLSKLNGIVEWFDEQEEVDVEVGLEKVKEGAELIKVCRKRLSEVENEFKEIQRDVDKDNG
ncbi:MAG: exodeoxyribonuclease VII small subunit [Candidatus Paceibacterota bacterium]|jgi:exodeoxyribonuclease VII small subunit